MAKSLAAPTLAYLIQARQERQADYKDQDIEITEARRIREMQRPALEGCDAKYQLVDVDPRDPSMADEAFRVQATMTLNRPKLQLQHRESDLADTNATTREKWTEQTLWSAGTRGQGQDTMRDLGDACLHDGGAWAKLLWSKDLWSNAYGLKRPPSTDEGLMQAYGKRYTSETKLAGPCFYWQSMDPLILYPEWGPDGEVSSMLEVTEVPLHTALRQYRLAVSDQGELVKDELGMPTSLDQVRGLPSHLTRLDFWDDTWNAVALIGGAQTGSVNLPTMMSMVKEPWKHRYGFLPYDFAPGLWMSHWRNRKIGWGVGRTKQWLVAYRAYLRAMHAQYVARDLLSPLFRQVPPGAAQLIGLDGQPLIKEQGPEPGTILNGLPGEVIARIEYPDAGTLEKHILMIDQAIEKLESPRVTTLEGLEGAGFAISQVLSFEMVRFGPIGNSLAELLKRQTLKLWSLVTNRVKETVYVEEAGEASGYLGQGPEDLAAPVGIKWTVNPERATDDLLRERAARERLQAGTMDVDSAIEYIAGNQEAWNRSPDEVRRGKARDRIRATPWYQARQELLVAQEAGHGDLLLLAQQAQAAAQNGQIPGATPGVMGNGQTPDLGNLAASPNGAGAAPQNSPALGTSPGLVAPSNGVAGGFRQGLGG